MTLAESRWRSCLDVVHGVMLERGGEFQVAGVVALQAADEGHAHPTGQPGVFAVALVDASPIGIAADIDHRAR